MIRRLKKGLILFTAAYIAFTALPENSSRSLQEYEVDLATPQQIQAQSSDGDSTESATANDKDTDTLVIIMGEKNTFPTWLERLGSINGSLSLLYGSFDEQIPEDACKNDDDLDCQVAFIPDTTWTEGRNLLAGEALRKEVRRGKKYDYWLFLDDDVEADCYGDGEAIERLLGEGSCWQKIFNFIGSDHVPENASTIALHRKAGQPGFAGFSTTDAMFAAFKRERVPYLLPYATVKEGSSQWTSQAALFCVMRTCLRSSAVLVPYVGAPNPIHHNCIRGKEIQAIRETIDENFNDEKAGFYPCTDYNAAHIKPYAHDTGTFETGEELNEHIPPPEYELCEPLKDRFERWKREQLASSRLG